MRLNDGMETTPYSNNIDFKLPPPPKDTKTDNKDEANGKIDGDFKQNLPGDCALLASIFSLSKTPEGAQAIEDALCIVKDEDDEIIEYNVTFEGTGETYTVTQEELLKAKSADNGRRYATGDDDVTVLELAFEKCFAESDDPTLRYLVDNYHNSNESDMLLGVNPQSITYLLTGKAIETVRTHAPEAGPAKYLTPVNDINTTDVNGEPVAYKSGDIYRNKTNTDKTIIISENMADGTTITVSYDTYVNNVLKENYEKSSNRAKELLENYENNPKSNVLIFGAPENAKVECVDGKTRTLTTDEQHTYIIDKVQGDTVTLLNASSPKSDRVTVKKDSLLSLDGYWVYGSDNTDPKETKTSAEPQEIGIASAIEEDGAEYYPNLLSFALSKLAALIGF